MRAERRRRYVEVAVGAERQVECGDAWRQRREGVGAAVRFDAVDAAVETAGDIQPARAIESERGRVRHAADERFARAVGPDDEDGHRRLLSARAAESHVEIAVTIV